MDKSFTIPFIFFALFYITCNSASAGTVAKDPAGTGTFSLIHAIKETVKLQPEIMLHNESVKSGEGNLTQARGQFDWKLQTSLEQTRKQTPFSASERGTYNEPFYMEDLTTYIFGISKQFRSGVSIVPSVQATQNTNKTFPESLPRNDLSIDFSIIIPLLRGNGYKITATAEFVAQSQLKSIELTLKHKISESIYNTALKYWRYLLKKKELEIYQTLETRASQYLSAVARLVEADEKPKSELEQLKANLASKTSSRILAEQEFFKARYTLGLAMGLSIEMISDLPDPTDSFPIVKQDLRSNQFDVQNLMATAKKNRADLLALESNVTAAHTILTKALDNREPKLDMTIKTGYSGLGEGDSISYSDSEGYRVAALFQLEFPVQNSAARGEIINRKSEYNQAVIRKTSLESNIHSNLIIAIQELCGSSEVSKIQKKAVSAYNKAVENEKKKYRFGMSTVTSVFSIEDRLISAQIQAIRSLQGYANALINLKYILGTLLHNQGQGYKVDLINLMEIPKM